MPILITTVGLTASIATIGNSFLLLLRKRQEFIESILSVFSNDGLKAGEGSVRSTFGLGLVLSSAILDFCAGILNFGVVKNAYVTYSLITMISTYAKTLFVVAVQLCPQDISKKTETEPLTSQTKRFTLPFLGVKCAIMTGLVFGLINDNRNALLGISIANSLLDSWILELKLSHLSSKRLNYIPEILLATSTGFSILGFYQPLYNTIGSVTWQFMVLSSIPVFNVKSSSNLVEEVSVTVKTISPQKLDYSAYIDKLLLVKTPYSPEAEDEFKSDNLTMELQELDSIQLMKVVGNGLGWGINKRSGDLGLFPLENCTPIVSGNDNPRPPRSTSIRRTMTKALYRSYSKKKSKAKNTTLDAYNLPMPEEVDYIAVSIFNTPSNASDNLDLTVRVGDRVELLRMLPENWGFCRNRRSGELGAVPMSCLAVYTEQQELELSNIEEANLPRIPTYRSLNEAYRKSNETLVGTPELHPLHELYPEPSSIVHVITEPHLQLSQEQMLHLLQVVNRDKVEVVKVLGHGWILGRNTRTGDIGAIPLSLTDWSEVVEI